MAKSFHLLTTTPELFARFWLDWIHDLRMVGLNALNLPQLVTHYDPCTAELLLALPSWKRAADLHVAIEAARGKWLPHWQRHINLVVEMAIAMAKYPNDRDAAIQIFFCAPQVFSKIPTSQEEVLLRACEERAYSLMKKREGEESQRRGIVNVRSPKLPWVLADASGEDQLGDAMTFLYFWRTTHLIGIESMTDGWIKPPATTLMPFPMNVLGEGFSLETTLEVIERFRLHQMNNLELKFGLLTDVIKVLRFGLSANELMMRLSAVMSKPLDMNAEMQRIRMRKEKHAGLASEASLWFKEAPTR